MQYFYQSIVWNVTYAVIERSVLYPGMRLVLSIDELISKEFISTLGSLNLVSSQYSQSIQLLEINIVSFNGSMLSITQAQVNWQRNRRHSRKTWYVQMCENTCLKQCDINVYCYLVVLIYHLFFKVSASF